MPRTNMLRIAFALALLGAIALALTHREFFDAATLRGGLAQAGVWAPLGYVALYAAATVLFLPGSVLTLVGGALFGPLAGGFYSLLGATLGASLAFLIARYLAAGWVERTARGWLRQLITGVEAEGWRFIAFLRLVPLFPFNAVNYALGLTRIPLGIYIAVSFVGMAPGALAYAWLGHAGSEALSRSEGAVRSALIALALLAAVMLLPRLLRRFHRAPRISPEA